MGPGSRGARCGKAFAIFAPIGCRLPNSWISRSANHAAGCSGAGSYGDRQNSPRPDGAPEHARLRTGRWSASARRPGTSATAAHAARPPKSRRPSRCPSARQHRSAPSARFRASAGSRRSRPSDTGHGRSDPFFRPPAYCRAGAYSYWRLASGQASGRPDARSSYMRPGSTPAASSIGRRRHCPTAVGSLFPCA